MSRCREVVSGICREFVSVRWLVSESGRVASGACRCVVTNVSSSGGENGEFLCRCVSVSERAVAAVIRTQFSLTELSHAPQDRY